MWDTCTGQNHQLQGNNIDTRGIPHQNGLLSISLTNFKNCNLLWRQLRRISRAAVPFHSAMAWVVTYTKHKGRKRQIWEVSGTHKKSLFYPPTRKRLLEVQQIMGTPVTPVLGSDRLSLPAPCTADTQAALF